MLFKNSCVLVLCTIVASAVEGLRTEQLGNVGDDVSQFICLIMAVYSKMLGTFRRISDEYMYLEAILSVHVLAY